MEERFKNAVEKYQCMGCTRGSDISCFQKHRREEDKCCSAHSAGTFLSGIGKILLGMPKGFNRLSFSEKTEVNIFDKFEDGWGYNKFNVPTWKYLYEGHTLVRGLSPRTNYPFIHVFLEDCRDKIDCIEITDDDIKAMD